MNVTDVLDYDPETGKFTWVIPTARQIRIGQEAGCLNKGGYIMIRVLGKRILAHRLAWLFQHSKMPDGEIDHINGNPSDNRISNLRECTKSENAQNRHKKRSDSIHNTPVGITLSRYGKYRPYIGLKGKFIHLGHFELLEDAVTARREFMEKHDIYKYSDV